MCKYETRLYLKKLFLLFHLNGGLRVRSILCKRGDHVSYEDDVGHESSNTSRNDCIAIYRLC